MTTPLEAFVCRLGNTSSFHVLVFLLLACNFYPIAFNHSVLSFYAYEPPHSCQMPEGWAWHRNNSIPVVVTNGHAQYHSCQMYKDPDNHSLGNKGCVHGWNFEVEAPEFTIVTEWSLVCDRKGRVEVVKMLYLGGCMLGALVFATFAEKFGRRPVMLFCLFGQTVVGIVTFFVQRYFFFAALRFVQGFLIQGLECATFVMVMELFPPRLRTLAGCTCFTFYAFGTMFLSLLGYAIQHWRYIQLAISLPSVITVFYICLIPESLRWLLVSQRLADVVSAVRKCTRFDPEAQSAKSVSEDAAEVCKQIESTAGLTCDMRDLFRSPNLRRNTLFHSFCWLSAFLMYSSMQGSMQSLSSNKYHDLFLSGLLELFAFISAFIVLNRFGRRKPLFLLFILGGVLSISSGLVDHLAQSQSESIRNVSLTLAVLAKFSITASIVGLYIFSAETFPTIVRSLGMGLCSFWRITGCLLAPAILLVGQLTLKAIPVILIGAVAMVAAFVILMLPETFETPLPDTVNDAENLGKRKTPVVDKASNGTGKITPLTDGAPLTPPFKRASVTTTTGESAAAPTAEGGGENKRASAANDDDDETSTSSRRSSKLVRFLGIDELDAHQDGGASNPNRSKKISFCCDGFVGEKRVRFSNVVHDIESLMVAINAMAAKLEDDDKLEDNVFTTAEEEENNNRKKEKDEADDDANGAELFKNAHAEVKDNAAADAVQSTAAPGVADGDDAAVTIKSSASSSDSSPSSVFISNIIAQHEVIISSSARPVVGILKKSSGDESSNKKPIVKSPHPSRKNSTATALPSSSSLPTEEETTMTTEDDDQDETDSGFPIEEEVEDEVELDDSCRPPSSTSSSSREPTPEGQRKSVASDDVKAEEDDGSRSTTKDNDNNSHDACHRNEPPALPLSPPPMTIEVMPQCRQLEHEQCPSCDGDSTVANNSTTENLLSRQRRKGVCGDCPTGRLTSSSSIGGGDTTDNNNSRKAVDEETNRATVVTNSYSDVTCT